MDLYALAAATGSDGARSELKGFGDLDGEARQLHAMQVLRRELAGQAAVDALAEELGCFLQHFDELAAELEHSWIRARRGFPTVRWRGESWASGHGALRDLLEEVLGLEKDCHGDSESLHKRLIGRLSDKDKPDLSPLLAAIDQEHAALSTLGRPDHDSAIPSSQLESPLYYREYAANLADAVGGLSRQATEYDSYHFGRALQAYWDLRYGPQFDEFERFVCRWWDHIERARLTPFAWQPDPRSAPWLAWSPALYALLCACGEIVDPIVAPKDDAVPPEPDQDLAQQLASALRRFPGTLANECIYELNRLDSMQHAAERQQAARAADRARDVPAPDQPAGTADNRLIFLPGGFVYRGQHTALKGRPRQVLEALDRAPAKTGTAAYLMDNIWKDAAVEEDTVRTAVSDARKALRQAMQAAGVDGPGDPLPAVDRGTGRLAWRLNLP
jgi:hypothetical protein